jgi:predicted TIM-barrel fold metal-dependent hydrolase
MQLGSALDLARELDLRLIDFYTWCENEKVPILTHAEISYGAGPCYVRRADPANWAAVARRFPGIRVCFGHFGDFDEALDGDKLIESKLSDTWEWHFAEMTNSAEAFIYADVSYLSEVLNADPKSRRVINLTNALVALIKAYPNVPSRLVYGTDYLLLALERTHADFYRQMQQFLRGVFDQIDPTTTQQRLKDVFRNNAIRFLGLGPKGAARDRLEHFYDSNHLDKSFLTQFE